MPRAHLVIESESAASFRVEQVRGLFDVPSKTHVRHEWQVDIPIEGKDWTIGLIVGPSGSGKTTIASRLFPDARLHAGYDWPVDAAIVDAFPADLSAKAITAALSSVGFSSPPHWLKRFSHLSNGQKFRCELARVMLEPSDTIIIDEFTSVVDRDAAKISSAAVAKAIRKHRKPRLIAASCHYDIVDWLDPDWIFDTANLSFAWRFLRGRPKIKLEIHEADRRAWALFRGHHYLSNDLSESAKCFVATHNGTPVAFTSYIHFPHPSPKAKNIKREHRTVVLPDYQGVSIGNRISEWLGFHLQSLGYRFRSTTSHPSMIHHRSRSNLWRRDALGHVSLIGKTGKTAMKAANSASRISASFEFVGRRN